ncbi:monocarboxylate transporter 12 [Eurytemora carolleeae]|uniref:monocarboxylate transporter 12 n=1 Tax=Eurytemora carolleeae TaxID=1294199 RepID=UPI000C766A07|nr:monocarboxylate transporter 12 [Eurytemora carolleeae]|eukprot:XP_023334419.1 monocarboxylate transporter 12-like [Eurytemora affinis]
MEDECDSGCSSHYSLGAVYRTRELPKDELAKLLAEEPNFEGDIAEYLADFPSIGSGIQPSEPQSEADLEEPAAVACTCIHENYQPLIKINIERGSQHSAQVQGDLQKLRELRTLKAHYYPEGGWGWVILLVTSVVQLLVGGTQISLAIVISGFDTNYPIRRLEPDHQTFIGLLCPMSLAVSLLVSPVTIALCRRKSYRLTGVVGGLVTALGYLFSSFATQFHQLFISYGLVTGIGTAMVRDSAILMVGQYFKRKREYVEVMIVGSWGPGFCIMYPIINNAIRVVGWRLGLQAITGLVASAFILAIFYRSASLYHPQRRAILHLKNQRRKIKSKKEDKENILKIIINLDGSGPLRSRTVQILLNATGISAFGLYAPVIYMWSFAAADGVSEKLISRLQTYFGIGWIIGCLVGSLVLVGSGRCYIISRQYLVQCTALCTGVNIFSFIYIQEYRSYVLTVSMYGFLLGVYSYSLKMYVFEKVRARNFGSSWGFVQACQAIPIGLSVPIFSMFEDSLGPKSGFYFCGFCIVAGSLILSCIDVHKRQLRKKNRRRHSSRHTEAECKVAEIDQEYTVHRRKSFAEMEDDFLPPISLQTPGNIGFIPEDEDEEVDEGDLEYGDVLLEELEILENITSCDKVEHCLMFSEFEHNLGNSFGSNLGNNLGENVRSSIESQFLEFGSPDIYRKIRKPTSSSRRREWNKKPGILKRECTIIQEEELD